MKFKIGRHDFYWFVLLFLFVALPIGLIMGLIIYFNDWYTILKWSVGLIIVVFFLKISTIYIHFIETKTSLNINILKKKISLIVPVILTVLIPLILYLTLIHYFEVAELRNHGKETVGFIYDYGTTRNSRYHKVYFMNLGNKKYETEIRGKYSSYKLGDTVRVIYSERIPEVNQAD